MDIDIGIFMKSKNPIRVMFLPLNYGTIKQDGVYDAFEALGCNLRVFDYMTKYLHVKNNRKVRKQLEDEVAEFKPNLLHLQIQHATVIDSATINNLKNKYPNMIITNWTGDVRNYVPPTYKAIAKVSDYNLISSTGQLDKFRNEIGKDIKYWQIGYNPKLYKPFSGNENITKKYDVVFAGNYTNKEKYPGTSTRLETCQLLRKEFGERFGLFGHGWPRGSIKINGSWEQRRMTELYQKSFSTVSVSHYNDIEHYFSDRLLMCLASGIPTISLRFPKWETYFTNMCDLVIVDSINDIPDAVRMIKKDSVLAKYIGESGANKVLAEHTYYSRVKELLTLIGLL